MSSPVAITDRPRLAAHRRLLPWLATVVARALMHQPPARIRTVLEFLRRGARPSTVREASRARSAVVAVSVSCAGEGCVQRSLATALLCRLHGHWPTWCSGVRVVPFLAHAWVEVDGEPVDEPYPRGYHTTLIRVPPLERS
ncbi:lasso peptide biosynthesis B2 protein [Kitasatospora sp. NPDC085464]|uniref:lasso peptide biosynthesis B2 protein n=1 Tax=Kitasatospora sp. NPDC085464 TaxID=3364063 RepID=UPI0037C98A85